VSRTEPDLRVCSLTSPPCSTCGLCGMIWNESVP
jgi:hypothetical protein